MFIFIFFFFPPLRPFVVVDAPLSFKEKCFVDGVNGKPSTTTVTWLRTFADGTHLLKCAPKTGHRHQIRCHLASIGLPIANDVEYGGVCIAGKGGGAVDGTAANQGSTNVGKQETVLLLPRSLPPVYTDDADGKK